MLEALRCIGCGGIEIEATPDCLCCLSCKARYPVVDGLPIFLHGDSLFSAANISVTASGFSQGVTARIGRMLPSITWISPDARTLIARSVARLEGRKDRCIVVGCGESEQLGDTLKAFGVIVFTDVVASPGASMICDGHELPFIDNSADAVVITAVLEHVLSPERVVAEISRVLRPGGMVIAGTPFISQVHMGPYDFQRFTDTGHRWLFRNFREVERGVTSAAGTALLWSIEYFARAFFRSTTLSNAAAAVVRLGFFWLKYLDAVLYRKPGAYDSGAGYYFVGVNAKTACITAKQLIGEYRGNKR